MDEEINWNNLSSSVQNKLISGGLGALIGATTQFCATYQIKKEVVLKLFSESLDRNYSIVKEQEDAISRDS